jgi:hypothetical protein
MTAALSPIFPILENNPGIDWSMIFEADDDETDIELDVAAALADALERAGIAAHRDEGRLTLDDGLVLQPLFLEAHAHDDYWQTVTTLQCNHTELLPDGVFEFQHATGHDLHASILRGFEQWVALDLAAVLDALRDTPERSMTMRFDLADGRGRRAVFGPFARYCARKPAPGSEAAEEAEKFCPCCLFTNSLSAMQTLLERDGSIGLRMFAACSADGEALADCRVNGIDFPEGAEALRAYVANWPAHEGYQFRKQYVILHDIDADSAVDA